MLLCWCMMRQNIKNKSIFCKISGKVKVSTLDLAIIGFANSSGFIEDKSTKSLSDLPRSCGDTHCVSKPVLKSFFETYFWQAKNS